MKTKLKIMTGTYEYGAQLKVVPVNRNDDLYFMIGGTNKENAAKKLVELWNKETESCSMK